MSTWRECPHCGEKVPDYPTCIDCFGSLLTPEDLGKHRKLNETFESFNSHTRHLATLFNTHVGIGWMVEYFYWAHLEIAEGNLDEVEAFMKFKELVSTNPFGWSPKEVEWKKFFEYCKDRHAPDTILRKALITKLEDRGVDPSTFWINLDD